MLNVLKSALKIIPKQAVAYKKFVKRSPNALGDFVNTYSEPISIAGSIQPAGASLLYKMGIANTEDIFVVYLHINARGVAEMRSNDLIIDNRGCKYNIIKTDVWYDYPNQDWNKVVVRRIKEYA